MLAIARRRVRDERVRFIAADLFEWRPDRGYDVVFFGRLRDGTAHRAVKVPHTPHGLESAAPRARVDIEVTSAAGPFFWGVGGFRDTDRSR